jgi:membrane protease YdiL (CAAX protease family)
MRPYFIAVACSWTAIILCAIFYSNQHPQLHWIMTAALPAFLIEAVFYVGAVVRETRIWLIDAVPLRLRALLLWLSGLIPYLVFSYSAGTFNAHAFGLLAALTGVLAYWFVLFPQRAAYEIGFLIVAAAPVVLHVFRRIYVSPDPHLRVDILGHLAWIHLGVAALLTIREWNPGAFGFWPHRREWRIGIACYLASILPIALLALALHDVRWAPMNGHWWRVTAVALGTFFAVFWVVALSEELFFRGVIQRALLDVSRSKVAAILVSAAFFGVVHLWFHQFPNWQRALVAAVLGVACGIAYAESGSVRAPMVTHAFVVTTWRVLFS